MSLQGKQIQIGSDGIEAVFFFKFRLYGGLAQVHNTTQQSSNTSHFMPFFSSIFAHLTPLIVTVGINFNSDPSSISKSDA